MNFLSSTRDTVSNDLVQRAMHPSKTGVTSYPVLRAQHGARTVPETQLVLTECSWRLQDAVGRTQASDQASAWIPAQPLTSYVTLGKKFNLSWAPLSLQNESDNE